MTKFSVVIGTKMVAKNEQHRAIKGEFLVLNRSVKLPFNQSVKASYVSRVTNCQLKASNRNCPVNDNHRLPD